MSEIKFRISSVSSQHPRFPAGNLTIGQDGWQSAIDSAFPQSITIQFYVPIRTRKLNILFHQYKIPRMMEVFVKLGGNEKYRKLGLLYPNDNSQSSFEEKEEKTLYFEFACTHIRFVLYENHKNERNIFNQVALEDLIVFGEILTSREIDGVNLEDSSDDQVSQSVEVSHNARTFQTRKSPVKDQEKAEPSPLFCPIYEKLQQEKQKAAAREDYQKAAHFKKILSNFKQLQHDINRLQMEKQDALAMEDYDRCHRIKFEIGKKREVVEFQREELFKNEEQFYSQNSFLIVEREATSLNESKRQHSPIKMTQFKSPQPERRPKNASSHRYDEQVVPALLNKNKSSENLPLQTNEKRKYPLQINQSIIPEGPVEIDNTSIKKDLNELKQLENPNQASISTDPRTFQLLPLENKLRMRIQTYFSFIPERIWQLCESKNWRAKQQALRFIRQRLGDIHTKQEFMGTIELLSRIIMSKHTAITLQVINLINKLADIKIKFTLQHMPFFVEDILNELLNFLNDTNKQTKELAYTTYLKLPEISFLGLNIITKGLIKHKNNVKNDPKLIITKLQLMSALLERYSQQEFSHKEIINWILGYFEDPNQKVKSEASDLLVTLTYLIGNEKVIRIIENSRPHMMESVLNMMNSSVDYSKIQHEQSKLSLENSKLQQQFYGHEVNPLLKANVPQQQKKIEKPIYVLQSNEKPYKMQQSKSSRNNDNNVDLSYSKESIYEESLENPANPPQQEQEQTEDKHCEYCNQSFDEIKQHYLSECKLLANCEKCWGFIYIRQFTDHLLNNCEYSHMFTACKKCGLAFELEESNEHFGRDLCRQKKGVNWERCQFCAEDVLAEDKFWLKHAQECRNLPQRAPPVFPQDDDQ